MSSTFFLWTSWVQGEANPAHVIKTHSPETPTHVRAHITPRLATPLVTPPLPHSMTRSLEQKTETTQLGSVGQGFGSPVACV
ncbi:MAG: hypothetical protein IVW55_12295 [Chloroflexi bacterium]|nr:hypothetical protein [Chloroflexota bacterium]